LAQAHEIIVFSRISVWRKKTVAVVKILPKFTWRTGARRFFPAPAASVNMKVPTAELYG
jgi:hypothetical protein